MVAKVEKQYLTESQKKILRVLALEGPSYYYELYSEKEIASNKTVLDALHRLTSLGLIEKKEEYPKKENEGPFFMGRKKTYYGLTFHGVLYCLNLDMFTEDQAAEVRLRNFAEVPLVIDPTSSLFPSEEVLAFWPKSYRDEFERAMLNVKAHLEQEGKHLNRAINNICSEAQRNKKHVKIFSMIEEKCSRKIYGALRRVNPTPGHYDEEYARYIFQKEQAQCFHEVFSKMLSGDKEVFDDMIIVLNDINSQNVLQKVLFPYYVTMHQKLRSLESNSSAEWLKAWKSSEEWFSQLAKLDLPQLKAVMRAGPKRLGKFKARMNRL
jgi:DNA-binding PadR family transcriptional regulator